MTDKQIQFCEEYLKDFNATQAAIRAGYSPQSAYSIGHENLKKPDIQNFISDRKNEFFQQNRMTLDTLIADLVFIKNKCIYEKFDAKNGINACVVIKDFLELYEEKIQSSIKKLSTEELEAIARKLLTTQ